MTTFAHTPEQTSRTLHRLADAKTMLRRNLLHAKRYPGLAGGIIIMPVVLLLLFNYIFGGALEKATDGVKYIDYLTPGMMLMIPAYITVGLAVLVATDMTKGIVNRFRTMHISQTAMLTGHAVGSWIQGMLGVTLMTLVALLLGFRSHDAGVLEWVAAFGLIGLLVFSLNWLGIAFGLAAKTPESASNLPMPIVMLPFLGSGLVPTGTMPNGVKQFAEYQPFSSITETLRGLLMGTEIGHNGPLALAWCVVIALAGFFWSTSLFKRRTH
ncbi:ABC transporter permease [Nocardia jejuensis]|uniref:ABC transporter permease n=1 Tax=Nocardia jejuensis TaxID=328049 RepID=UPI0008344A1D|nr:ABC transporter permease [Nocardia jejuensis]